jgi:RHS repeat-associated protein
VYIDDIAILSKTQLAGQSNASYAIRYTLRDRLGSVVSLTNEANVLTEHRSYDPFGKPRKGDYRQASPATLAGIISGTPFTQRGFTDHEHLDAAQLIHMNGRVYDYNLGRFLSVDPIIQSPGNSQSLNPYSYIMNNPLAGTDPTGYRGCAASRLGGVCEKLDANQGGYGMLSPSRDKKGSIETKKGNGAKQSQSMAQANQPVQASEIEGQQDTAKEQGKNNSTSGVKEAGKHSKLFDKDKYSKYGTPSEPDSDELSFVKGVASKFESSGEIESCALVCKSDSGEYSLSEIRNDNSRVACDTSPLSCSSGSTPVSDIHNHPPAGEYVATKDDVKMNPKLVEGQRYKANPMGFSRSDLSVNFSFGINGWVTPSGTDKILYFDSNMQYPYHLEYKNE